MEILSETLKIIMVLIGLLFVIVTMWDKKATTYNKMLLVFIYCIMLEVL